MFKETSFEWLVISFFSAFLNLSYQQKLKQEDPEKYEQMYGRPRKHREGGEHPCPAERRREGKEVARDTEATAVLATSEAAQPASGEVKA